MGKGRVSVPNMAPSVSHRCKDICIPVLLTPPPWPYLQKEDDALRLLSALPRPVLVEFLEAVQGPRPSEEDPPEAWAAYYPYFR